MNIDRIDFISSYCDRWCERCGYTSRCSTFAAEAAIAMCGDDQQGLELAFGRPHPAGNAAAPIPEWLMEIEDAAKSATDATEFRRVEDARDLRVRETTIVTLADAFAMVAHHWLAARAETLRESADETVREALDIARHDALFILVKLRRAIDGRDRHDRGEDVDDHPAQNDWDGSAKVALISVERSASAWDVIAQATGDDTPAVLASQLRDLKRQVEFTFPHAWSFVRPGFDEPGR